VARIRSIKPDFWTSEQVMECSPIARLMFIGLWNFADDHGRLPCAAKTIKAQIFPADDISSEAVRRMIDELSSNGLIQVYVVDEKEYLFITGWHHQKIDRRQPAKYPEPPPHHSTTTRRAVSTDLRGSEGIEEDRKNGPVAEATRTMPEYSEIGDAAAPSTKTYAFESGIIRLNQQHFDQWKNAFSHLELAAELLSLSQWAESEGKNWFHAVKGALAKRNREVKAAKDRPQIQAAEPRWLGGIEGVI
jgi:hypothetical protein